MGVSINHYFFDYVSSIEKGEIVRLLQKGDAHIVSFEREPGRPIFAAVIEKTWDSVHVREVGGAFVWRMKACEDYCRMYARYLGLKMITFRALNKFVVKIGERLGFVLNRSFSDGSFELKKDI